MVSSVSVVRGRVRRVRLDLPGGEDRLLVEEELAGVAGVAALVAGVGPGAVHVDLRVDVHAAAPVPAREDRPEGDEAVLVRLPRAAQIALVVGRLLVAARTAGPPVGGAGRRAGRRVRGAPLGGVPPPPPPRVLVARVDAERASSARCRRRRSVPALQVSASITLRREGQRDALLVLGDVLAELVRVDVVRALGGLRGQDVAGLRCAGRARGVLRQGPGARVGVASPAKAFAPRPAARPAAAIVAPPATTTRRRVNSRSAAVRWGVSVMAVEIMK